ncbi:MAG: hypothetical protein GXO87_11350 [Chlorobi bacterium]|nr:hypothetical protein [Chlorobiota bacterium]
MKMDWNRFINRTVNVTLHENYGVVYSEKKDEKQPNFYEIVFKTGKLVAIFDDGLLLESVRESQIVSTFIPYDSLKCVDIF